MNSSHASRTQRAIMAAASLVLLACTTLIAHAQVTPGEYVYPGGFGVLKIVASNGGALQFDIEVVGGNFHTCNLSGVIRNNEARMEESADDKQPCIVTFKPQKDGLAVDSKFGRACSTYCGMRADFTGVYQRPPSGCAPSQVRHSRNRFKAAYDKKQYAEARGLLAPVVEKCLGTLNQYGEGWVRNDMAITYYRTGEHAACRDVLKPWLELAQTPDSEIKDGYPPSDAEEMLRLAQATRANMKVCGAPVALRKAKP